MTTINCFGKSYSVEPALDRYTNGKLAVQINCGENRFGTLSTNVLGVELGENEFCVKVWSENSQWAIEILNQNKETFEDTGRVFQTGFVQGPIYRLK